MTYHGLARAVLAASALVLAVQAYGTAAAATAWRFADNDMNSRGAQPDCALPSSCTPTGVPPADIPFARQGADWLHSAPAGVGPSLRDQRFSPAAGTDGGSRWMAVTDPLFTAPDGADARLDDLMAPDSTPAMWLEARVATSSADASPVPVPAAVWLFGSGLIALSAMGRRRFGRGS